ncbi:hypothetical protein IMG5_026190, partial [Ichthyophthirius multifiliis]
ILILHTIILYQFEFLIIIFIINKLFYNIQFNTKYLLIQLYQLQKIILSLLKLIYILRTIFIINCIFLLYIFTIFLSYKFQFKQFITSLIFIKKQYVFYIYIYFIYALKLFIFLQKKFLIFYLRTIKLININNLLKTYFYI